jgi:N-acetylglucosaminyl-diphospho-decaprenol L-rhamnosyltransferase
MPEPSPLIRVAVVTFNSERVLAGLLDSLPGAMQGLRWELVVTDNGSTDASLTVAARYGYSGTFVRMGRNAGYAAGINTALAVPGKVEAVLVVNPDVRLDRGTVPRLLAALDEPGTGIAVPRLTNADGELVHTLRRRPTVLRALGEALLGGELAAQLGPLGETVTDQAAYERHGTVDWASGAVQLISTACLEAVGPWDESFLLYSEETDFALRAGAAGFATRFVPDACGVHIGGEAHTSAFLWSLLTTNRVRLYAKHHGTVATRAFWSAVTLGEGLRAAVGRQPSRAALKALLRPSARVTELPPAPEAEGTRVPPAEDEVREAAAEEAAEPVGGGDR